MGSIAISEALQEALDGVETQEPVAYIYHPLRYARELHHKYLEAYGKESPRKILWVGMNPGPWGMAQTGIPFGDVASIRDFLALSGTLQPPDHPLHPKKPVLGLACKRQEVSGQRLWGWIQGRFQTPQAFFSRFFVWNFCPLLFLDAAGRNLTPDKLPRPLWARLEPPCRRALEALIAFFQPSLIFGLGRFAEKQILAAKKPASIQIGYLPHPSPQSPLTNVGWPSLVEKALLPFSIFGPLSEGPGEPPF